MKKVYENVPDCSNEETLFTMFVIQSKLVVTQFGGMGQIGALFGTGIK